MTRPHVTIEDPVNHEFRIKLANLLKARFPYIFLTTWEEHRAMSMIQAVASNTALVRTPREVYTWSLSTGLTGQSMAGTEESREPERALEIIHAYGKPAIFVIKDFKAFCSEPGQTGWNRAMIRRFKDLSDAMRKSPVIKCVIFVAEEADIPTELEKDFFVLDLHLPTIHEIRHLLQNMINVNKDSGRIEFALSAEDEEALVQSAMGLTLREAENAFAYAMVEDGRLDVHDVQIIQEEKSQIIRKSEILEVVHTEFNMDDVGGLENLKAWLHQRNGSWLEAAKKYSLPDPRGMLITGVPGCGKSLVAKSMSSLWKLPLLRLDPGKIYAGLMGSSEMNIRKATKTAEAIAPCVLWIDEIEKGFSQGNSSGDSGTSARVFGSFLTWMQEKSKPVFVVATANNIDRLPPEFLRKGRFDEIFFVDLPTKRERMGIFKVHLLKRLTDPEVAGDVRATDDVLSQLADRTEGFSGAEIESVIIAALFQAFSEKRALTVSDIVVAIQSTVPLVVTQAEQVSALREWAQKRAVSASEVDAMDSQPVDIHHVKA